MENSVVVGATVTNNTEYLLRCFLAIWVSFFFFLRIFCPFLSIFCPEFSLDVYFFIIVFSNFSIYSVSKPFKIDILLIKCKIFLLLCILDNFGSGGGYYELYLLGCYIPTDIPELCSGIQLCYLKQFDIFMTCF